MPKIHFLLAPAVLIFSSACNWVDNTGVQPGAESGLEPTVKVTEEVRTDLDFTNLGQQYINPVTVESWALVNDGQLDECSVFLDSASTADSLDEACSPTEDNCEMVIVHGQAANGAPDMQLVSVFPPQLSAPVGVRYRWYLIDGAGEPQSHETTLCVDAVNNPPIAENDQYSIALDAALQVEGIFYDQNCEITGGLSSVLSNDSDDLHPNAECLRAELVQGPNHSLNDFTASFTEYGGFEYQSDPNRTTPIDAFTYRVTDGVNYSDRATVTIITDPEAYTPQANEDEIRIDQNSILNQVFPMENDFDPFGSQLSIVEIVSDPNRGGTVTINQAMTITYTPRSGFRGNEQFTYRIRNIYGLEDTARVLARVR